MKVPRLGLQGRKVPLMLWEIPGAIMLLSKGRRQLPPVIGNECEVQVAVLMWRLRMNLRGRPGELGRLGLLTGERAATGSSVARPGVVIGPRSRSPGERKADLRVRLPKVHGNLEQTVLRRRKTQPTEKLVGRKDLVSGTTIPKQKGKWCGKSNYRGKGMLNDLPNGRQRNREVRHRHRQSLCQSQI